MAMAMVLSTQLVNTVLLMDACIQPLMAEQIGLSASRPEMLINFGAHNLAMMTELSLLLW
jgi:hypothetical protein